ncbi:MAG: hypothetical protein PGN08_07210 [Sphingomonas taxi]
MARMRAIPLLRRDCSDPFTIRIVSPLQLVEVTMRGFWDLETVALFERQLLADLTTLTSYGVVVGEPRLVIDLHTFDVQTLDVLNALAALGRDPLVVPFRIALFLSSSLLRLQLRRVTPQYALFDTRDEALAYVGGAFDRPDECVGSDADCDLCRAQG